MTITISAKSYVQTQANVTEVDAGQTRSDNTQSQTNCPYTYGSGSFQITGAFTSSGIIASGANVVVVDALHLSKAVFGYGVTVGFTGIKSIQISNMSTASGNDIRIVATGTAGLSGLFNGGSGNLLIKPYSSFVYNDPYTGIVVRANNSRNIFIRDVNGTGVSYSYTILGILVPTGVCAC